MIPEDLKAEFNRKQIETKGYCAALQWVAAQLAKGEKVDKTNTGIQAIQEATKTLKK